MDYVNDDRYYKVSAEAEGLRGKFNALQQEIEARKATAENNPSAEISVEEGMSVEEIMTSVKEKLERNTSVTIKKSWIPQSPDHEGDGIYREITMPPVSTGYCEQIWLHEDFPANYLEGDPILREISKKGLGKTLKVGVHKHEDRDQYEVYGRSKDIPLKEALRIVEGIVTLIGDGRRIKPDKKDEYERAIENTWFGLQHPDWSFGVFVGALGLAVFILLHNFGFLPFSRK